MTVWGFEEMSDLGDRWEFVRGRQRDTKSMKNYEKDEEQTSSCTLDPTCAGEAYMRPTDVGTDVRPFEDDGL